MIAISTDADDTFSTSADENYATKFSAYACNKTTFLIRAGSIVNKIFLNDDVFQHILAYNTVSNTCW